MPNHKQIENYENCLHKTFKKKVEHFEKEVCSTIRPSEEFSVETLSKNFEKLEVGQKILNFLDKEVLYETSCMLKLGGLVAVKKDELESPLKNIEIVPGNFHFLYYTIGNNEEIYQINISEYKWDISGIFNDLKTARIQIYHETIKMCGYGALLTQYKAEDKSIPEENKSAHEEKKIDEEDLEIPAFIRKKMGM